MDQTKNTEITILNVMVLAQIMEVRAVLTLHIPVEIKELFADRDIMLKDMRLNLAQKLGAYIMLNHAVLLLKRLVETKKLFAVLDKLTRNHQKHVADVITEAKSVAVPLRKLVKTNKLFADQDITQILGPLNHVPNVSMMLHHAVQNLKQPVGI